MDGSTLISLIADHDELIAVISPYSLAAVIRVMERSKNFHIDGDSDEECSGDLPAGLLGEDWGKEMHIILA